MLKYLTFIALLALFYCDLIPQRLGIIDSNQEKSIYLVRGNLPIANKKMQMKQLKRELSRLTGLKSFKLVMVSLLNSLTPKETKNRYIEQKYFEKNPLEGEYRNKLILGSLIDPSSVDFIRDAIIVSDQYFSIDQMDDFVSELRDEVTKGKGPKIIYVHCSAGVDRTGYVAGSYRMKYKKESYQKVVKDNLKILEGLRNHMHFNVENGMKWFCLSLNRSSSECNVQ